MKYFKRLKLYKASNVTYSPETKEAYSYGWWQFTKKIGNVVLFNNYTYSSSTSRHQSKVSRILRDNKENILYVCLNDSTNLRSLSDRDLVTLVVKHYNDKIAAKLKHNATPRVWSTTKEANRLDIIALQDKIKQVQALIPELEYDAQLKELVEGNV
jgi:ribosomal protein S30